MAENSTGWHLSRNVPITLIIALAVQAIAIVGTYYKMQNNIVNNANEINRFEADENQRHQRIDAMIERMRGTDTEQAVRLERIDATVIANQQTLSRIEQKIDTVRP